MIKTHDVCIVGAGPAGLQAAYLLKKQGLDVCLLERGSGVSGFFRRFPRHRNFISINKVHTGLADESAQMRYDWNSLINDEGLKVGDTTTRYFPKADEFVTYLENFADLVADSIITDAEVNRISKTDDLFTVQSLDGRQVQARHVIVSAGVTQPWLPEVEGIELTENYMDFDTAREGFNNKRVLILGKGNAAFESAKKMLEHASAIHVMSPNPIKFSWDTHFVGHVRAVNAEFMDTYQLKSQNAVVDASPVKIEKDGNEYVVTAKMTAAEGHEIVLRYDRVICCTGFRFDAEIFDPAIRPGLRHFDKFPAMTAQWEAEDTPNLWFAGTLMQSRDFKKTMSGFVHGFRYNIAALTHFIAGRIRDEEFPTTIAPTQGDALSDLIVERISLSDAMFLQPGFLGDVIHMSGPTEGRYYCDIPMQWAAETPEVMGQEALTITLEFGDFGQTPTHVKRAHSAFEGAPDPFIHPVLRHYRDGELQGTMHLSDHLDSDWRRMEDKAPGEGTVTAMTFADLGQTLPIPEVVRQQIAAFLDGQGLAQKLAAE